MLYYILPTILIFIILMHLFLYFYDFYFSHISLIITLSMCGSAMLLVCGHFDSLSHNLPLIIGGLLGILLAAAFVYICFDDLIVLYIYPAAYAIFSAAIFVLILKFFALSFPEIGKIFILSGNGENFTVPHLLIILSTIAVFFTVYFIKYVQILSIPNHKTLRRRILLEYEKKMGNSI